MQYDSNVSRRQALGLVAGGLFTFSADLSWAERKRILKFWGSGTLDLGRENWKAAAARLGFGVEFSDNGNDIGPILAQMINGTAARDYDVGGIQGGAEIEMARARVIEPWNLDLIPNWKLVWEAQKRIPWTKYQQKQISLPVVVNADSIIYLKNETGVVDSYSVIFDPKFRGRTSMEDAWINSVIFTAMFMKSNAIDGLSKIKEPGDLEVDELHTVMEFLKKHKRDGQFYNFWRGWQEGVDLIVNRRVVAMTGWEPIVYAAREKGIADAQYAIPKEGYEGWSNNLVLHVGAANRGMSEAAHAFANWQLSGPYGCILGALRGYMVPTDGCIGLLDEGPLRYWNDVNSREDQVTRAKAKELRDHVSEKFSIGQGAVHWQNTRPRNYQLYEKLWSELRAL